ncbi:GNAT family N-acetyltransferase [Thiohalorhabdus methylotrophus]|uniref:GNAT family N-acetyltransferase n=1 Tax=Thiohalorhabdus methylotrophus TaxID=3242694 RepID=A0ABV4TXV2_9GAMM
MRSIRDQLGPLEGGLYLLSRGLGGLTGDRARLIRYYLFWQPTPQAELTPPGRKGRFEVRPIGRGDPALEQMPRPAEVLERRLSSGDRCLGAFRGEELAGFLWYAEEAYREDEARCTYRLPDGGEAVWDYDVYVDPARRLSPVFAQLWDEAAARFRRAGVRGSFSRISAFNTASLASQYRLGGRKLGSVTFLALGRLQLALSSYRPHLHLSLSREPIFRLALPESEEEGTPAVEQRNGS